MCGWWGEWGRFIDNSEYFVITSLMILNLFGNFVIKIRILGRY